jgi:ATP-dependent RNA helicase DDX21
VSLLTTIFLVQDHFERGSLNLKTLKFRVLDEADEMLNMGFVDDVETILGKFMPPLSQESCL